jgi:hypothetical protein
MPGAGSLRRFASSPSPSFDRRLPLVGGNWKWRRCWLHPAQELKYLVPCHTCMLLAATRDLDRFVACSKSFQPALGIPNTGQTGLKSNGREAGTLIRG